jgi:hypothetical protein
MTVKLVRRYEKGSLVRAVIFGDHTREELTKSGQPKNPAFNLRAKHRSSSIVRPWPSHQIVPHISLEQCELPHSDLTMKPIISGDTSRDLNMVEEFADMTNPFDDVCNVAEWGEWPADPN